MYNRKLADKNYSKTHKKIAFQTHKWYIKNKQKVAQRMKKWWLRNKIKILKRCKIYKQEHKKEINNIYKLPSLKNPYFFI